MVAVDRAFENAEKWLGLARLENAAGRDVEEIRALVTEGTRSPRAEVSR